MKRLVLLVAATALALGAAAQTSRNALDGVLGNILRGQLPVPGAAANPAPAAAAPAVAGDLIGLLMQQGGSIDEAREIEIGRQLAAVLLGSKPLHADAGLQRYVNTLGRWIALQSSRPQLPWAFGVLDDAGFNAFAAPGGFVFVTKGLVDRVTEAELAGILAHEISHVTERHHLAALRTKAQAGAATQLLASQLRSDSAVRQAVQSQLLGLARNLYSSGLDQADEYGADRLGVALATRAGFDPYGLPAVLQQLRTQAPDNPLFSLTLATHPPAQARLEQLEQAMGQRLDAHAGKPAVRIEQRVAAQARR